MEKINEMGNFDLIGAGLLKSILAVFDKKKLILIFIT